MMTRCFFLRLLSFFQGGEGGQGGTESLHYEAGAREIDLLKVSYRRGVQSRCPDQLM